MTLQQLALLLSAAALLTGCGNRRALPAADDVTRPPTDSSSHIGDAEPRAELDRGALPVPELDRGALPVPDAASTGGLVGWWPANGSTADIVGGHNGILKNGASYSPGIGGEAFRLDGEDQWVEVPDTPALNVGTRDFTVELWVRFDSLAGEQVLAEKWIQKYGPPSLGWTLTKLEHGPLRFTRDGYFVLDTAVLAIQPDTWHHVAARRAGNTAAIFFDGVIAASVATSQVDLSSTSSLKFGHRGGPSDTAGSEDLGGFYLRGRIDEVKLFNRGLTEQEIWADYTSGATR